MIKHVVMVKIKDSAIGVNKDDTVRKFYDMLLKLPERISQIKHYEVGINEKISDRASDVVIVSEFENWDALKEYIQHTEHQKVSAFIKEFGSEVRAVDYEF